MSESNRFARVLVRLDLPDGGAAVINRPRATTQTRFISSIPSLFAILVGQPVEGEVSGDVAVEEIEACVEFLAQNIRTVEGLDDLEWSGLKADERAQWVDSLGQNAVGRLVGQLLVALYASEPEKGES